MAGHLQAHGELMGNEFAQEDGSCLLPASYARGVVLWKPVRQERRTASGPDASRAIDVFVCHRDAQQRACVTVVQRRLGGMCVGKSTVGSQGDKGTQGGIELLDPSQERACHLDWRQLSLPVARSEFANGSIHNCITHGGPPVPAQTSPPAPPS